MDSVMTECAMYQTEELEVLRSMYSPRELIFSMSQSNTEQFELGSNFMLRIDFGSYPLEISIQFSLRYPICKRLDVFIRSTGTLNDTRLNYALREWINEQELAKPLVLDIIMWLRENVENFKTCFVSETVCRNVNKNAVKQSTQYMRYWIFSHHLFSSTKRSNIMKLTKELGLVGFVTPGKPAIVVVEGIATACKDFWGEVKSWAWQKISLRHTEEIGVSTDCLKFKVFREIILPSSDSKHVKIGAVKTILSELGLEDKFNIVYNLNF